MIRIVPLDEFDPKLLSALAGSLYAAFGVGAEVLPQLGVPDSLPRPYNPTDLVAALPPVDSFPDDRILFLTSRELQPRALPSGSAPTYGLSHYDGRFCLLSIASLGEIKADNIRRLTRFAMQEIGHAYGLHHCLDPRCAMYAHWTKSFPTGDAIFCTFCREKSEQRIRQVKA